ncbi:MAG TPA: hypothetical protein PKE04_17415, partial [Clostridia bacterium]|nr:hypothetical protein [Clostridia bacterium]
DTLVYFNKNDANGNGVQDERMAIPLGSCNTTWGGFFDNGIAQWFGLAPYVFQLNRETWEPMIPFRQEGFVPYVQFLRKCVEAGVLYLSDNVGKNNSVLTSVLAQDVASAYFYMATADMNASADGGLSSGMWTVLPKIQGTDGIEPVMDGSRGYKAWGYWGISSAADPQTAANFLDVALSTDYSIWYAFGGIEGKTYQIVDGMYEYIGEKTKEEYLKTGYCTGNNCVYGGALPQPSLTAYFSNYKGESLVYDSYQSYLNSVYFNEMVAPTYNESQLQGMKTWVSLAEELQMYNMNGDLSMIVPMATAEEAEVIGFYQTDLYTYMDELFGNLISGAWPVEDMDKYLAQLDGLGMQELCDIYAAQYGRLQH